MPILFLAGCDFLSEVYKLCTFVSFPYGLGEIVIFHEGTQLNIAELAPLQQILTSAHIVLNYL